MSQRYEIRLAGEGGQGMLLAGAILAEAAAIYDGRNVIMTQAYVPQQRGGFTETELVLSDGEIDYPKILAANLLLALTQDAFNRHSQQMAKGGLILIDPSLVDATEVEDANIERLPLKEIAIKATGSETATNLVALGVISGLTKSVSLSALTAALRKHFSGKSRLLNEAALRKGFELGKALHAEKQAQSKARGKPLLPSALPRSKDTATGS